MWADSRALVGEIKLGDRRISVRTDGGLQILIPGNGNQFVEWDRSYYEIGLEVLSLTFVGLMVGETILQNDCGCGWQRRYP